MVSPPARALVVSVRQRRQFVILRSLGFTQRQLASSLARQSSVAAVRGVIAGVPIAIELGRWSWRLFAQDISAVPDPAVPVLSFGLVAFGALLFANLAALLPGRGRRPDAYAGAPAG